MQPKEFGYLSKVISKVSFEQAKVLRYEAVWSKLKDITVGSAVISWLGTYSDLTRINNEVDIQRISYDRVLAETEKWVDDKMQQSKHLGGML